MINEINLTFIDNISESTEINQVLHLPCIAQTLQLAVKEEIKQCEDMENIDLTETNSGTLNSLLEYIDANNFIIS